jgi:hypothetical protein
LPSPTEIFNDSLHIRTRSGNKYYNITHAVKKKKLCKNTINPGKDKYLCNLFHPSRDERKFDFYVKKRVKRKKQDQERNQTQGEQRRTQTGYLGRHVEKVQEQYVYHKDIGINSVRGSKKEVFLLQYRGVYPFTVDICV